MDWTGAQTCRLSRSEPSLMPRAALLLAVDFGDDPTSAEQVTVAKMRTVFQTQVKKSGETDGAPLSDTLVGDIKLRIRNFASPRHTPAKIIRVADIPRTMSGKIAELAVRDVIHERPVKNTSALANPEALEYFQSLTHVFAKAKQCCTSCIFETCAARKDKHGAST